MVVEDLLAWNTHIRSSDLLRKSPKRHFTDPSLAVGALGLSVDKPTADLNYLGLLFESPVIRDLRVYAEANGGKVYHYRDSRGFLHTSYISAKIWMYKHKFQNKLFLFRLRKESPLHRQWCLRLSAGRFFCAGKAGGMPGYAK